MINKNVKKKNSKNQKSNDLLNDKFKYLVNHVLEAVQRDTVPFLYDKKEILLGNHFIQNEKDSYVIYNGKQVIGEEPCYFLLESAMLVSYAVQKNRQSLYKTIQELDKSYTKYYFDCVHIHKTIKALRAGNDEDNARANMLIDKYFYAREKRNYYKHAIRNLCLRNIKK